MACEVLVPQLGTEPAPPALAAQSLNHWAAREVQLSAFYDLPSCFSCLAALSSPQEEEEAGFTGRRMNSKMQVYSGSKCAYLPKMMTLHEQCIRVLKNNIDCKSHASPLLPGVLVTGWPDYYSVPFTLDPLQRSLKWEASHILSLNLFWRGVHLISCIE